MPCNIFLKKHRVSCDGRLTIFEGHVLLEWCIAPTLLLLLCKLVLFIHHWGHYTI